MVVVGTRSERHCNVATGRGSSHQPAPGVPEEEGSARGRAEGKVPFIEYLSFLSYRQCSGSRIFLWTLPTARSLVLRGRVETTTAYGNAQCWTGCLGSQRIR